MPSAATSSPGATSPAASATPRNREWKNSKQRTYDTVKKGDALHLPSRTQGDGLAL